jgi:hypothetical protein
MKQVNATSTSRVNGASFERRSSQAAIRDAVERCRAATLNVGNLLLYHQQHGSIHLNPTCSPEQRDAVRSLLMMDVFDFTSSSRALMSTSFGNFSESISARADYDQEYFSNKTAAVTNALSSIPPLFNTAIFDMDLLVMNFSVNADVFNRLRCFSADSSCVGHGFYDTLNAAVNQANSALNTVSNAYTSLFQDAIRYTDDVEMIFTQVNQLFSVLSSLPSVDFMNIFGSTTLPSLGLRRITFAALPAVSLPTLAGISANLLPSVNMEIMALDASMASLRQLISDRMATFDLDVNALTSGMPTLLEDYNPPPLLPPSQDDTGPQQPSQPPNATVVTDSLRHLLDSSLPSFEKSIGDLKPVEPRQPSIKIDTSFRFPSVDSDLNFSAFEELAALAGYFVVGLDIVYRILKSVRVICKSMRGTSVTMPDIDIAEKQQVDLEEGANSTTCSVCVTFASGPILGVLLVLGIVAIVLLFVTVLYLELYRSYTSGCVDSKSGSFFSRNAGTFTFHLASTPGLAIRGLKETELEVYRIGTCNQLQARESLEVFAANDMLTRNRTAYQSHSRNLSLLRQCVMDSSFPDGALKTPAGSTITLAAVKNYMLMCPPELLSQWPTTFEQTKTAQSCWDNMPQSELDTCPGVSSEVLRTVSHTAACESEWMVHATVIQLFCVILFYASLNVSRKLLLSAITGFFWQYSGQQLFQFRANCGLDGRLLPATQAGLQKQINKTLRCRMVTSFFKLLLAVAVYIPPVFILLYVSNIGRPLQ